MAAFRKHFRNPSPPPPPPPPPPAATGAAAGGHHQGEDPLPLSPSPAPLVLLLLLVVLVLFIVAASSFSDYFRNSGKTFQTRKPLWEEFRRFQLSTDQRALVSFRSNIERDSSHRIPLPLPPLPPSPSLSPSLPPRLQRIPIEDS